ncbi:MAG: Cell division protein FtsX [Candidatus Moranbacteria bacterium GW2011_GWC2_37_8]|nr:MAG: Cell division protein FtsX [Candidatus Moranbacteria bacterium GW2011_GWC2_37_8]KKQ63343.1 MAG: Cell division protein FtsX [Parcubacteria group bacterium GW2011_GWC1_38_22]
MRFIDLFKLSTRMFKARTSRTLLTVLGMSIGIAAILFLVSLGYGLQKTLLERITTSDSLLTLDVSEAKSGIVSLNRDMIKKIEEMNGVDEVSPAFQIITQGRLDDLSADLTTIGSKPSFLKLGGFKASKGVLLSEDNKNGIVISSAVAQVFGKTVDEMMGKEMSFSFFVPKTIAPVEGEAAADVAATESDSVAQSEFNRVDSDIKYTIVGAIDGEDNIVYLNASSLDALNIDRYGQVKVKTSSNGEMTIIRDTILEYGLLVSSLSDTVDQANQIFKVLQIILMLFGVIALVVSAIGMFNTMTITLLERTEEIGIMKSIGASDLSISVMFFMESAIMGFLGGCAGVSIGWLGGLGFNTAINMVATRFGGQAVSLFYSPTWFVLAILGFSAVVGFMTGYVPARRASKIDPLDALRYK